METGGCLTFGVGCQPYFLRMSAGGRRFSKLTPRHFGGSGRIASLAWWRVAKVVGRLSGFFSMYLLWTVSYRLSGPKFFGWQAVFPGEKGPVLRGFPPGLADVADRLGPGVGELVGPLLARLQFVLPALLDCRHLFTKLFKYLNWLKIQNALY